MKLQSVLLMNNVFVVVILLDIFVVFGQIIPKNFETKTNIRHSRSRLLRGRRHGDEIREDFSTTSIFEIPSLNSKQFLTENPAYLTDNSSIIWKDNNRQMLPNLSKNLINNSSTKNSATKRKQSVENRRVTVGGTSTGTANNSWHNVDKSVLYMGERALNQMDSKKKNRTSTGKDWKNGGNSEDDVNEPLVQNSLVEDDIDGEIEQKKGITEYARSGHVDIVTRFLRIVESQHLLGENCTAGTDLNLGEGVVDRYAQERFRVEADVAVNRANMLTRLWKYADRDVVMSEYLLHASVFSMVEFDDDIFAAGNCYDQYQYKDYWLFCPYAYRLPEGTILVKDLAIEYKYHSNTSEWFYIARKNAENVIKNFNHFSRGEAAKIKWKGLRDTFRCEYQKHNKCKQSGAAGGEKGGSLWCYFDSMYFLADQMTPRESSGNIPSPNEKTLFPTHDFLNNPPDSPETPNPSGTHPDAQEQVFPSTSAANQSQRPDEEPPSPKRGAQQQESSTKKHDGRPAKRGTDVQNRMLAIEEEKLRFFKQRKVETELVKDFDYHFLMSLLPHLKNVKTERKLHVQLQLQQVLLNEIMSYSTPPAPSSASYDVSSPLSFSPTSTTSEHSQLSSSNNPTYSEGPENLSYTIGEFVSHFQD